MNKKLKKLIGESKKENGVLLDFSRDFQSKEEMQIFFLEYGYVSLKKFIPLDAIENVVDDLKYIFKPFATDKANPIDSGIINLDKSDKKLLYELCIVIRKLSSKKHLTALFGDITKSITGKDNPVLEISSGLTLGISRDDRLVYNFHQESVFMENFADNTNAHFPLLRMSNLQNGTMSILPGTHKLGTLETNKSQNSTNSVTNKIPKNINEIVGNFPELHCCLELGDVILFHKDLIHRSNYNSSALCRLVGGINLTQSLSGDW